MVYLILVLLAVEWVLISQPIVEVEIPLAGMTESFTVFELQGEDWLEILIIALHIISLAGLLIPMVMKWEKKRLYYVPALLTSLVMVVLYFWVAVKLDTLMTETLLGNLIQLVSVDVAMTTTSTYLIIVSAATFLVSLGVTLQENNPEQEEYASLRINIGEEIVRLVKRPVKFFKIWMNDIEVNKIAYNAMFVLLVLGIVLIGTPIFKVSTAFDEKLVAMADIEGLTWISMGVTALNIASFASLLMPNLVPLEWKTKWIMPVTVTSILECGVIIYLLVKIEDILGAILNILSMEIALTVSGWLLLLTFVLTLVCAIKVIWDIRNNCSYS